MNGKRRRLRVALILTLSTGLFTVPPTAVAKDQAGDPRCSRPSSPTAPQPGEPLTKPVEFSVIDEPEPINLGNEDFEQVIVKATPPLDKNVTSENITGEQISLYSSKIPQRVGENLETAHLDEPKFSEPQVYQGKRISFFVCFEDGSVDAGAYQGEVLVGGPEGVTEAAVTMTVNKKDGGFFAIGLIVALLLGAVLFTIQALKTTKDELPTGKQTWGEAWKQIRKDPWFIVPALLGLGGAVVVMWQTFEKDPTWGASPFGAGFALIGAGLSAMGITGFIASFKKAS